MKSINWYIMFENNVINIEKGKFFKHSIYLEDLIDIQTRQIPGRRSNNKITRGLEIRYFDEKNKIRKIFLPFLTIKSKAVYMTDVSKLQEFVNCFSHSLVDSDDYYSEWKNINRDDEKIEKIKKEEAMNKFINKEVIPKKVTALFVFSILMIMLTYITIVVIYNTLKY